MTDTPVPLTTLLHAWCEGDGAAFGQVLELAFDELKHIAARRLRSAADHATCTPADLLNEAVLRVLESPPELNNRAHFLATLSLHMRSVLVDRARARLADKRGGGAEHVTLLTVNIGEEDMAVDLLAMDQALGRLAGLDARAAEILHLTYFAGLSRDEIAGLLQISIPTVDRDLKFARSWLNKALDLKPE